MTKEFRVEAAQLGVYTKDGTRSISWDAQIDLKPGAYVLHVPYMMPEAASVAAELTGLEVENAVLYLTGYGLPGVVEALEQRKVMIALDADDATMEFWTDHANSSIFITKMTIKGGLLCTPEQYCWELEETL